MRREYAPWMVVALLLLAIGLLVGRWAVSGRPEAGGPERDPDRAFREWFWNRRNLDLITQVGLIFAGALGVAAILPGQDEARSATGPRHPPTPGHEEVG